MPLLLGGRTSTSPPIQWERSWGVDVLNNLGTWNRGYSIILVTINPSTRRMAPIPRPASESPPVWLLLGRCGGWLLRVPRSSPWSHMHVTLSHG